MKAFDLPVDSPLTVSYQAETGQLTVACYQPIAGQAEGIAMRLVLTPQAAAALSLALRHLESEGIDLSAAATPPTRQ